MLVANRGGLPQGDTEDPVLIAQPRGGVPAVVDTPADLERAASRLRSGSAPVALDVERALGFRYGSDPYLVQIRREDVGSFLIDSHALPDLSPLNDGVGSTWLLHDCSQDLPNLRAVGLRCPELFDTEIAARLVGMRRFGLASVAESVLGLALVKDHQAADWSVRPLPKDWLRYAALDVELLTELYRRLSTRLHDLGRWEWAAQEFAHALSVPDPRPDPERWRSVKGAGALKTPRQLAYLRELWSAREGIARDLDLSPGRLVRNSALIRAASRPPANRRALLSIGEFRSPVARQYTDQWMRALTRARTMDDARLPRRHRRPAPGELPDARTLKRVDEEAAARLGQIRLAVAGVASALDLDPEVVLAPRVQRYIAWAPLGLAGADEVGERMSDYGARPWQIELTAAPVRAVLGL